jgi:hypothetical protein
MFEDYIEKCEYTLIGMQILENFHTEDTEFFNNIINPDNETDP